MTTAMMMRLVALLLLVAFMSSACLAMEPLVPEPAEDQIIQEQGNDELIILNWQSIPMEERKHWRVLEQIFGEIADPEVVYQSLARIIEIRGNTRFKLNILDNDLLRALIQLKQIYRIADCSEENIRYRNRVDISMIPFHFNLQNYVQHHDLRLLKYCSKYLISSVEKIIENLGSERRKRINNLRRTYFGEPVLLRLTDGLSKFIGQYDSSWAKEYSPGTAEHRTLFELELRQLFSDTCEQMLRGLMQWVRVYRQLSMLRWMNLEFRTFDKHTLKWIKNTMACDGFSRVQDPRDMNYRSLYQSYVISKMNNQAQLYPI